MIRSETLSQLNKLLLIFHSTETALVRVHNDVVRALGEQKVVLFVMLDLSAAFDMVNYECLLTILDELGVRGTVLQWFRSYLHDRPQLINIKGTHSDTRKLTCGVPQGSVLGPILFTIYTSSLGRLLRQHLPQYHLYADDSTLYLCVKPSELPVATKQIEVCVTPVHAWDLPQTLDSLNQNRKPTFFREAYN